MDTADVPVLVWDTTDHLPELPPLTWDTLPDVPVLQAPDQWPAPIAGY